MVLIVAAVLFSAGFACNSSDTTTSNGSAPPANSSAPPQKAPVGDIAGTYDAVGTNPNGGQPYKAALVVTPHDDVYQFTWTSGKSSYDGVGVMTDSEVAVSYTDGGSGKGCGVVLYKVASDGSMDGKVGYWGNNSMEREKATRKTGSGPDLDGVYDISGTNPDGKSYSGTLTVIQSGEGYTFDWSAGTTLSGFGMKAGNYVAVGFGGAQCSFVGYDLESDGTLKGRWGSHGSTKFGTEVATRKK
jgi:hypothetical protein